MKISIINGPNLNLLGNRENDIYGSQTFESYLEELESAYPTIEFQYYQSNVEGELINELQRAGKECAGIIFNPAGYTHTSVAIGDTIAAISAPLIEVHISNIFSRESFRIISHVSAKAKGVISGLGLKGYELALQAFLNKSEH